MKLALTFLAFALTATAIPADEIRLTSMLAQVQKALARSETRLASADLPSLKHVNLTLKVISTVSASGKVSFWVVTAGASGSSEFASTFEMRLEPPDDKTEKASANDAIAEALVAAIIAGAETKLAAENGKPPLVASRYSVTLIFTVVTDGSGGLSIGLPPFKLEAGGEVSAAEIQEISIVFEDD